MSSGPPKSGIIDVPRQFFDEHDGPGGRRDVGIDHAYAVTSYAVQGATYDNSTSRIDEHASRSEAYVDLTRGRHANHLFLTRSPEPLDGEHLPKAPPPPIIGSISRRLHGSGPERAAIEFAAATQTTAVSTRVRPSGRKDQAQERQIARDAVHSPPAELVERLPSRSVVPYLARKWDRSLEAILSYGSQWKPETFEGPFGWALDTPADTPQARAERSKVERSLKDLALGPERIGAHAGLQRLR